MFMYAKGIFAQKSFIDFKILRTRSSGIFYSKSQQVGWFLIFHARLHVLSWFFLFLIKKMASWLRFFEKCLVLHVLCKSL